MSSPHPIAKEIPSNPKGRDFVMGDLHGSYPALERLLNKVGFEENKDRIICVGDLVNKGPDSLGCLKLLEKPWFHSALGNHDEAACHALQIHFESHKNLSREKDPYEYLAARGGLWLCKEIAKSTQDKSMEAQLFTSYQLLKKTPRILKVGNQKDRYHVVHGALAQPTSWTGLGLLNDQQVNALVWNESQPTKKEFAFLLNPYDFTETEILSNMLRDNPKQAEKLASLLPKQEKLSTTFCGHRTFSQPTFFLSHYHIDTGAGKIKTHKDKRRLTLINPFSKEIHQVKAHSKVLPENPKKTIKILRKELPHKPPEIMEMD